jgi:hypothetical protein
MAERFPGLPLRITENGATFDDEVLEGQVHDVECSTTCAVTSAPCIACSRLASTSAATSSGHSSTTSSGPGGIRSGSASCTSTTGRSNGRRRTARWRKVAASRLKSSRRRLRWVARSKRRLRQLHLKHQRRGEHRIRAADPTSKRSTGSTGRWQGSSVGDPRSPICCLLTPRNHPAEGELAPRLKTTGAAPPPQTQTNGPPRQQRRKHEGEGRSDTHRMPDLR